MPRRQWGVRLRPWLILLPMLLAGCTDKSAPVGPTPDSSPERSFAAQPAAGAAQCVPRRLDLALGRHDVVYQHQAGRVVTVTNAGPTCKTSMRITRVQVRNGALVRVDEPRPRTPVVIPGGAQALTVLLLDCADQRTSPRRVTVHTNVAVFVTRARYDPQCAHARAEPFVLLRSSVRRSAAAESHLPVRLTVSASEAEIRAPGTVTFDVQARNTAPEALHDLVLVNAADVAGEPAGPLCNWSPAIDAPCAGAMGTGYAHMPDLSPGQTVSWLLRVRVPLRFPGAKTTNAGEQVRLTLEVLEGQGAQGRQVSDLVRRSVRINGA